MGWEVVNDRLGDQPLVQQHSQHFGPEESLDLLGVAPDERPESVGGGLSQ